MFEMKIFESNYTKQLFFCNILKYCCYCSYCTSLLFRKLPWKGDSKWTFWSMSQTTAYLPVYATWWILHTVPFNAESQEESKLYKYQFLPSLV